MRRCPADSGSPRGPRPAPACRLACAPSCCGHPSRLLPSPVCPPASRVRSPPPLSSKIGDGSWPWVLCFCNRALLIFWAQSRQILLIPSFALPYNAATLCCHCMCSLSLQACEFLKGRDCFIQLCPLGTLLDTPALERAFWVHALVTAPVFLVNRPPMIPILTPATMICTQVRLGVCLVSWVLTRMGPFISECVGTALTGNLFKTAS